MKKMSTGIPGLDEVFLGGFIPGQTYLVVGAAGTGKTIFSIQWLREGARLGEKCLYITLAGSGNSLMRNVKSFGWTLEGIRILDLSPHFDPATVQFEEYHVFSPSEVEEVTVWQNIYRAIIEMKPNRLVIDSGTQLRYLSTDDYQFRNHILAFTAFLNVQGITTLLPFESTEFKRETSIHLAVDAIIQLQMDVSVGLLLGLRSLQVTKYRGSGFLSGNHSLKINDSGLHIFPHEIETASTKSMSNKLVPSGISALDKLLGGGVDEGTNTIISGPTGIGKTSLAVQFLYQSVKAGNRGIIFTFEESANSIINRSRDINIDLAPLIKKGDFKIQRMNSMEVYPDEFLQLVRHAVEVDKFNVVMIDSLRGYQLAMEEFGSLLSHVHNLVTYLNRMQVTTFLINEIEDLTGYLRVTEMGLSHLADNIILLRYSEMNASIIKIISCLKKRLSDFNPELREIHITSNGIIVDEHSEPLNSVLRVAPGTAI